METIAILSVIGLIIALISLTIWGIHQELTGKNK